jgi:hypothetical protein
MAERVSRAEARRRVEAARWHRQQLARRGSRVTDEEPDRVGLLEWYCYGDARRVGLPAGRGSCAVGGGPVDGGRKPVRGEVVEAGLPLGRHDGDIAAHLRLQHAPDGGPPGLRAGSGSAVHPAAARAGHGRVAAGLAGGAAVGVQRRRMGLGPFGLVPEVGGLQEHVGVAGQVGWAPAGQCRAGELAAGDGAGLAVLGHVVGVGWSSGPGGGR